MATERLDISPQLLEWAVRRAGLSPARLGAMQAQYDGWVGGAAKPTLAQLQKFAAKCHVAVYHLFGAAPPQETYPIAMFRRSRGGAAFNLNVLDTINTLQERQAWLSEYLRTSGHEPQPYVGSHTAESGAEEIRDFIIGLLGLSPYWVREYKRDEDAIRDLAARIEDRGIAVCFNSCVNNNTSRPLPVDECRGFALSDRYAPFVFVNSADAKGAQMFTLIHELAHIVTGYTSGYGADHYALCSETERLCDTVAAITLVPDELLREEWRGDDYAEYERLSKRLHVSRPMIARRAMECGLISEQRMHSLLARWRSETPRLRKPGGGADFNAIALKRCSRLFLAHLNNAINGNYILHLDAYRLCGLRGDSFHALINSARFTAV